MRAGRLRAQQLAWRRARRPAASGCPSARRRAGSARPRRAPRRRRPPRPRPRCRRRPRASSQRRTARARRRRRSGPGSARSRRPRQPGPQAEVAAGVAAVLELAARQRDALGEADQPGARPGDRRAPARRPRRGLRTSMSQPRRRARRRRVTSTAAPRRVLAGVGQPLLHDPVGGAAERRRAPSATVLDAQSDATSIPAARDSVDQRGQVGERRLRRLGPSPSAPSRSTPITSRRSCSAWCALARITPAASRDLLGRRVGAELERARVHAQQRDPVREHVVHLARDPRPLGARAPARRAAAARPRRARRARAASARAGAARARTSPSATATPMIAGRASDVEHGRVAVGMQLVVDGRRAAERDRDRDRHVRNGRWTATVKSAISAAADGEVQTAAGERSASATPTG